MSNLWFWLGGIYAAIFVLWVIIAASEDDKDE